MFIHTGIPAGLILRVIFVFGPSFTDQSIAPASNILPAFIFLGPPPHQIPPLPPPLRHRTLPSRLTFDKKFRNSTKMISGAMVGLGESALGIGSSAVGGMAEFATHSSKPHSSQTRYKLEVRMSDVGLGVSTKL